MQAVLRRHLFAERGLVVVERGQAVEEFHLRIAGQRHHLAIYLIPAQQRDTLRPLLFGFAHRYPDVGIDKVRALHARRNIFGQRNIAAVFLRQRPALLDQLLFRPAGGWRDQTQIQPGQRGGFEHGVAHIIPRVAGVDQGHLIKGFAWQMLLHGQ